MYWVLLGILLTCLLVNGWVTHYWKKVGRKAENLATQQKDLIETYRGNFYRDSNRMGKQRRIIIKYLALVETLETEIQALKTPAGKETDDG